MQCYFTELHFFWTPSYRKVNKAMWGSVREILNLKIVVAGPLPSAMAGGSPNTPIVVETQAPASPSPCKLTPCEIIFLSILNLTFLLQLPGPASTPYSKMVSLM